MTQIFAQLESRHHLGRGRVLAFDVPQGNADQYLLSHPVKIIVQTCGGIVDRRCGAFFAENLSRNWGQQAYVFNQPGAGARSRRGSGFCTPPDGETLLSPPRRFLSRCRNCRRTRRQASTRSFRSPMSASNRWRSPSAGKGIKTFAEMLNRIRQDAGGVNCAVSTRGMLIAFVRGVTESRDQHRVDLCALSRYGASAVGCHLRPCSDGDRQSVGVLRSGGGRTDPRVLAVAPRRAAEKCRMCQRSERPFRALRRPHGAMVAPPGHPPRLRPGSSRRGPYSRRSRGRQTPG